MSITSTLLKSDQWLSESYRVSNSVRGAINFRNIPGTNIYASGQPTECAVDEVVHRVKEASPDVNRVVWVTLREEPIVYVNGAPYCLRRERFSLRNMKGLCAQVSALVLFPKGMSCYRLWRNFCFQTGSLGRASQRRCSCRA